MSNNNQNGNCLLAGSVASRDRSSKNGDGAQNDPTMVESESEDQYILKLAFL